MTCVLLLEVVPNLQIAYTALEITSLAQGEYQSALIEYLSAIGGVHLNVLHLGA